MPQAARVLAVTSHGTPLTPGPGSVDVFMESMPAWRALPAGMAAAVEGISNAMSALLSRPYSTPADATADLAQVSQALVAGGVAAAAVCGVPAAAGAAASQAGTLTMSNASLTSVWISSCAVPGAQAAATAVYNLGIKVAAATAASATLAAMTGISDMDLCPAPLPVPHGPGFVTRGSTTVIIDNLPAARAGDLVMEACGGTNPITLACPTIFIDEPVPAAGFGAVRSPVVFTPPFGNTTYASYGPHIVIVGSKEFVEATVGYLQTLDGTKSGNLLLESLSSGNHDVMIKEAVTVQGNMAIPDGGMADAGAWNRTGTDANVSYYPKQTNMYNSGEDWDSLRPEVGLAHELIHADHMVHGNIPGDPTQGVMLGADPTIDEDVAFEEARTVGMPEDPMYGLPDNSSQPYSENTIRDELGDLPRMYYNDPALGTW